LGLSKACGLNHSLFSRGNWRRWLVRTNGHRWRRPNNWLLLWLLLLSLYGRSYLCRVYLFLLFSLVCWVEDARFVWGCLVLLNIGIEIVVRNIGHWGSLNGLLIKSTYTLSPSRSSLLILWENASLVKGVRGALIELHCLLLTISVICRN
jgi:hypothetical protein